MRIPEEKEDARETREKSLNKEPELPKILGQSSKGERPLFSELRFKRLLEVRDSDELLQQLRRALAQTNGSGHWLHLVDTVTQCHRQWAMPEKFTGSQQWQYRWSNMYYTEVFKYLKEVKS
jgi:CRISPR type I-E-associated protein CasB/Cse2